MPGFVVDNVRLLLFTSASALLVSIVAAAALFWGRDPLAGFPVIGHEWGDEKKRRERFVTGAKGIYLEGYKKFKDGVYQITTVRRSRTIVIAPKYLEELRKLPDDVVCNQCAADEVRDCTFVSSSTTRPPLQALWARDDWLTIPIPQTLESRYTMLNTHEPLHGHVMKTLLTPGLRRLNPRISDTITTAVHNTLPSSTSSWTPLNATSTLLHIVAAATGAIGVGTPLCLDPTYLDASVQYAASVMRAMAAASRVPSWCRWLVAPWLKEVRELKGRIREMEALVGGVMRARRESGGAEKAEDLLQWTVDGAARFGLDAEWKVVRAYLGFVFAAVHSTTVVATNVLFNLAAMPPAVTAELRAEAAAALAKHGHGGVMTFDALQDMPKLDSFMKETLRLYPLQFANFQRKVLKPFALSTTTGSGAPPILIPAHTVIEVPTMAVSLDPQRFPDPHRFDPWRFCRLGADNPSRRSHQFATVADDSTNFGWGRHACPGRFFAANEIKMVVVAVLGGWDLAGPSRTLDGMDPVSAFSLAAGVIQVVDYGTRLLSTTYEIYQSESGKTARDVELSTLSQGLSDVSEQLKNRLCDAKKAPAASENALLDLCRRCVEASAELQSAVNALEARGTTRVGIAASSFVSALRSIWTESEVDRLRGRLTEIRSQMTIATLVSVWEETRQDGERHLELRNRLDEITEKLDRRDNSAREFAIELKKMTLQDEQTQQSKKYHDLVQTIWDTDWTSWAPNERGRLFNVTRPADLSLDVAIPVAAKILSSLSFSDMASREGGIPKAYAKTFGWIFRTQRAGEQGQELQWTGFPAWLRETSGSIYWITGKPGSGKSTLMKFIFEHHQLRRHLRGYADGLPLMLAGFFFWNPGSRMQKSQEGLIRTILHQCLHVRQDLIPVVLPRRWALYNLLGSDSIAPEWTWKELKEAFEALSSYHGKAFRLALFVDGLDEFDGDHKVLIQWAKDNIASRGIKLCVSSRPWNMFADAFGQGHSLTMQDLTRPDIEHFVRTEFDKSPAYQDLKGIFPDEMSRVLKEIISKAEGVFLWVNLAVRSLLDTLTDNPSLPHLEAQLDQIPSDIMGLYSSIWRSIPPEMTPMSSKLFQLCVVQEPAVTTGIFWLATEGIPARTRAMVMDENARRGISKVMKRLLDGHTRGILETSANQVRFLHRSARDWITKDTMWEEICSKTPEDFDPHMDLLEAHLTQPITDISTLADFVEFIRFCLVYGRGASKSAKVEEDRLVRALDCFNGLVCDWTVPASGIKIFQYLFVDAKHADRDGYSSGHWSTLQYRNVNKENSFIGIAAQNGILRYVRAKVSANNGLLESKPSRISLLENAVFPGLDSVRLRTPPAPMFTLPTDGVDEEQLQLVRFLLDVGNVRYKTAFDESLYDVLLEARRSEERFPGLWEWYDRVLPLLKKYGYGSEEPGGHTVGGDEHRNGNVKILEKKVLGRRLRSMLIKLCP
ncbi:hypothetical protein SLS58_005763 [Diplodia intermedia]|uniref:NACHT domain-containing protein n=1 Tax=Diplodia intermedia TaxID=856260 RepID=A0ABR3TQ36_9PEZI